MNNDTPFTVQDLVAILMLVALRVIGVYFLAAGLGSLSALL